MKTLKKMVRLLTESLLLYLVVTFFVLLVYAFRDSFATAYIWATTGVVAYLLGIVARSCLKSKYPSSLPTKAELVKQYSHVASLRKCVIVGLFIFYVGALCLLTYKTFAGDRVPLKDFKADVQYLNELAGEETIPTKYLWLFGSLPTSQFNQTATVVKHTRTLIEDITLVAEAVENADSVDDKYLDSLKEKVQQDQQAVKADNSVSRKDILLSTFAIYVLWFLLGALKVFIEDALKYHTKLREIERSNQ